MIFLIEYDRSEGMLVSFQGFEQTQRQQAEDLRLNLELELNRKKVDHEIVLLEAENEGDLRKTHRRYFENLRELLKSAEKKVG